MRHVHVNILSNCHHDHLVVSVGHVVPAGAEPLEQEDGPGGGLDQSEVSFCGHVTSLHQSQVTCTATITTSIQEEKSNGSRKAVGEMMPVLLDTRIVMPVSRKGTEKSITDSLEIMDQH